MGFSDTVLSWLASHWGAILAIIAVACVGSFIQRVAGFGFGIFAMIFLVRICDTYWEATTLSGIFSIFCTTVVVIKMWKYCNFKKLGNPLIPALAVNAAIFLVFEMLGKKTPSLMFILLGIALIVLSLWFLFFSKKVKVSDNVPTGLACGTLSGVMSGLFAMGGPPVVVYFLATAKNNNNEYIATI